MRNSWAQPSLSRDFALLASAILFILCLLSTWVSFVTFSQHVKSISVELEKESIRIEHTLEKEMEDANYMLTALGRQIILDPSRDLVKLAQILKSFDSKGYIYSIFSWVSTDQRVIVSSNRGVLEKPVDISDRDYVKKAMTEPWKMHIGRPIEGRVSGRWVIPVAMGLTDYTGKFIGTIQVSIDINTLTEQLTNLIKRDGISFAIVSKTLIPLTQVSDDRDFVANNFPVQKLVNVNFATQPSGLITQGNPFWGADNYAYYLASEKYPYIILLGYDTAYSNQVVRSQLWVRLVEFIGIAVFFVLFLWLMRVRMIRPVLDMTKIAAAVAKGEQHFSLPKGGPLEIEALAVQIRRVGDYIAETKRIEDELRNKMFMLKKAKERAEMDQRSKSDFMAYLCQEMRHPLNSIVGFAQVMKDQLYGPIENRKYKQYTSDIYHAGNGLLNHLQDLQTLASAENGYIVLNEKPLAVPEAINKALHFVEDKMRADKISTKIRLPDPLPKLLADEFRFQQILMNLFLYVLQRMMPESTMLIEGRTLGENRDRLYFALVISGNEQQTHAYDKLMGMAEHMSNEPAAESYQNSPAYMKETPNLGLQLAKMLARMHHGSIDIAETSEGTTIVTLLFGANRLKFLDI